VPFLGGPEPPPERESIKARTRRLRSGNESSPQRARHHRASIVGLREEAMADPGDAVVGPVEDRARHEGTNRAEYAPQSAEPLQRVNDSSRSREESAILGPNHQAVGKPRPVGRWQQGLKGRPLKGREAKEPTLAVGPQHEADRAVAQTASSVVEEGLRQFASARRAATRASMLGTVEAPSLRKRKTPAEPGFPAGLRMSMISLVGKVETSKGPRSESAR